MFIFLILLVFSGLMLWAIHSDITRYHLSNRLCLLVVGLYPLYLGALYLDGQGLAGSVILTSVLLAVAAFTVCAIFFAFNIMGGGDVKLIPGVVLWAGPAHIMSYLFLMSLIGGGVAAVVLVKKRLKISKYHKSSEIINFSVSEQKGMMVPYGIGIAGGGLYVAWQLGQPLVGKIF